MSATRLQVGEDTFSLQTVSSRVSIIVPIYNREAMLAHVLQAIKIQDHTDIELIIVDDGSDDLDADRFWSLANTMLPDFSVKYVRQTNLGVSAARNHGIRVSSGEFLYFLDSDDLILPWAISHLLQVLNRESAAVAVARVVDCDFSLKNVWHRKPLIYPSLLDYNWYTHAALYRTDTVRSVGGFHEGISFGEDLLFHFMVRMQQRRISFSPTVIGARRHHGFGQLHERGFAHDESAAYLKAFADTLIQHPILKHEPPLKRVKLGLLLLHKSTTLSHTMRDNVLNSVADTADILLHDLKAAQAIFKFFCVNRYLRMTFARGAITSARVVPFIFRFVARPARLSTRKDKAILDSLQSLAGVIDSLKTQ